MKKPLIDDDDSRKQRLMEELLRRGFSRDDAERLVGSSGGRSRALEPGGGAAEWRPPRWSSLEEP